MTLGSGKYLTKVERTVVVWPAPDMNGDGAVVWVIQYDNQGRQVGRMVEKDKHGNEVRSYLPPKGFENRPGYDNTPNYVKVDERGEVERQPNGESIVICPGQALVFEPDGSVSILEDEYQQYVFGLAHDSTELEDVAVKADSEADEEEYVDPLVAENETLRKKLKEAGVS